jgi:predicted alpha-1,2-mannosidase
MQYGYVPATSSGASSSVSLTIEYGQDDAALANLADALGHASDASTLRTRLHGWQKLYDPKTGLLWAKDASGNWATPHGEGSTFSSDFDEADAQQSVWGPWYDVPGLQKMMGGPAALVTNLESFFENGKTVYDSIKWSSPLSVGAVPGYYWGGNEPDIHSPYVFALSGRPDLTQKWLPWIEQEVYTYGDDGIPGNDDAGTMSAWLVFSMLGFYGIPGTDQYVVGAPMFPKATIAVSGGTFTVTAPAVSSANVYVQSVTLNGAALTTPMLHHSDLKAGGTLAFVMGPEPSGWGQ